MDIILLLYIEKRDKIISCTDYLHIQSNQNFESQINFTDTHSM